MLRSLTELLGNGILATDGEIGRVHDFYFDDQAWAVRYMIADTGGWLSGRLVLLSPVALGQPDWKAKSFPVNLTRTQVEESLGIESHLPISRRYEQELHRYYGWPPYWGGGLFPAGMSGYYPEPQVAWATRPQEAQPARGEGEQETAYQPATDPHLRSLREVTGYGVHARDGDIGHVEDFLVQDEDWTMRYMVLDTRTWLPSKDVLLATQWVEKLNWEDARIYVQVPREKIAGAPEYKKGMAVNRKYEQELQRHYGMTGQRAQPSRSRPGSR